MVQLTLMFLEAHPCKRVSPINLWRNFSVSVKHAAEIGENVDSLVSLIPYHRQRLLEEFADSRLHLHGSRLRRDCEPCCGKYHHYDPHYLLKT